MYSLESGGRSYGGSRSRPTSTIEASAPLLRSSAAAWPQANPPISRYWAVISELASPAPAFLPGARSVRAEEDLQLLLQPRIENGENLVARLEDRVRSRHETAVSLPQDRDQQAPLRHVELADPLPRDPAVVRQHHLDDLQPLLRQVEQVHEPVLRDLVLQQPQNQVRRGYVGLDPEQLEVGPVPRIVDPRDHPVDQVLLLGHLADQHVVLVVAGHRDHHVGPRDAGSLEHPQLRRIAVLDAVLQLLLHRQVPVAVVLDHGHLVTLLEQLASQVPADLARPGDDDVLPLSHRSAGCFGPGRLQNLLFQHLDRDPRRADRAHPLLLVPLRAQRIQDPRDHGGYVEPSLRDLGDDDVRVVAVGGGDEGVRPLDPRGGESFLLQRGPHRELTALVLPGLLEVDLQTSVRLRVLVETGDLVTLPQHGAGHRRPNPPTTDDQNEHGSDLRETPHPTCSSKIASSGATTDHPRVVRPLVQSPARPETS